MFLHCVRTNCCTSVVMLTIFFHGYRYFVLYSVFLFDCTFWGRTSRIFLFFSLVIISVLERRKRRTYFNPPVGFSWGKGEAGFGRCVQQHSYNGAATIEPWRGGFLRQSGVQLQ